MEKVYSIKEIMQILKISRMTTMKILESRQLKSVRAGARYLVSAENLKNYLQGAWKWA